MNKEIHLKNVIFIALLLFSFPVIAEKKTKAPNLCKLVFTATVTKLNWVKEFIDGTHYHRSALDETLKLSIDESNDMRDMFVDVIAKDFPERFRDLELEKWFLEKFREAGGALHYTKDKKARDLTFNQSIALISSLSDFKYFHEKLLKNLNELEKQLSLSNQDQVRVSEIKKAFEDYGFFVDKVFSFN